jgi:peptidyl-prolyl cis-trans isomerase D
MKRTIAFTLAFLPIVAACDGFKEAMTAHVDVAAKAGSQELSVQRLADLVGNSRVPLRPDVVKTVANLWVDYQLLGRAAANNDSLDDPKLIDNAMWAAYAASRIGRLRDALAKGWNTNVDSASLPQRYASGELLAARHILVNAPPGPEVDSLRQKAEQIRAQAAANPSASNFATLANKYNQQGAAGPGGELGVFSAGQMVPEFSKAVQALKPGEISPVVRSQFGYHIIRRSTFEEAKPQFAQEIGKHVGVAAESTYLAKLEANNKIEVRPNAPTALKALAVNPDEHKGDKTVIATSAQGDFTVAQAAKWINGFPNPAQLYGQIQQAPDSVIPVLVKNLQRQEILLHMADSAKIGVDTTERKDVQKSFVSMVANTWSGLHIAPRQLADSAKSSAERERLAASRVDQYMDALLKNEAQFVQVPAPLSTALREKYEAKVNDAGVERALQAAQKVRQSADSARSSQQPPSAVPMPGATPQPPSAADTAKQPPTKKP